MLLFALFSDMNWICQTYKMGFKMSAATRMSYKYKKSFMSLPAANQWNRFTLTYINSGLLNPFIHNHKYSDFF